LGIDRRVMRTRTALYDALVALILRKDYDAISVQDILVEADIGRSTFYAHFTSKDDLLERSLERLRGILLDSRAADAARRSPADYSLVMFEHVGEHRQIYFALVGSHAGALLVMALREVFAGVVREMVRFPRDARVPAELAVQFIAGSFITVMTWWLERSPELAPRQVDLIFRRLVSGHATGPLAPRS